MKIKQRPSKTETFVGSIILAALILIIAGLFYIQSDFSPAVRAQRTQITHGYTSRATVDQTIIAIPTQLKALTPAEMFSPDTLFEKINGQAELYLSSGFKEMRCQRFALNENEDAWFEMFIYEMAAGPNAFAVFSSQRRADAASLDLATFAYRTANALFLVHGRYYVEAVASQSSEPLFHAMLDAARSFISKTIVAAKKVPGSALFPEKNLNQNTLTMIAANVFGFDQLNQVYTAVYDVDGVPIKAYVSKRQTADEARRLADGFYHFLSNYGGHDVEMEIGINGARVVEIMETYEIIFSTGVYLAGVHEAEDKNGAGQLARQLYTKLKEMSRE